MGDRADTVALLAGASGLTGGWLLAELLEAPDFGRVYAVTRRPLGREHLRLANRIVQFDRLEAQLQGLVCHTAFCCLGASAQAIPEDARAVELGYALAFARAARASRVERFVYLSCAGVGSASSRASVRFKQEAERSLEALGFASLDILQPGPLLGLRREMRGSDLATLLTAPLVNLASFGERESRRGISARTVAAAMLGAARSGRRGTYRYTYSGIRALARSKVRASPARADVIAPGSRQPRA
jgi:uncharacterized protein YbjT (DUF2867 family)